MEGLPSPMLHLRQRLGETGSEVGVMGGGMAAAAELVDGTGGTTAAQAEDGILLLFRRRGEMVAGRPMADFATHPG